MSDLIERLRKIRCDQPENIKLAIDELQRLTAIETAARNISNPSDELHCALAATDTVKFHAGEDACDDPTCEICPEPTEEQ